MIENPAVREYVYAGHDLIVKSFLRDGTDGWRLDVAVDTGFKYLEEFTNAAHAEKPGSLPNPKLMNPLRMLDLLGEPPAENNLVNGMIRMTVPPMGFLVPTPEIHPAGGYSS